MSSAGKSSSNQLRVSSYDRVSSWLVAMLVVSCVTVGALLFIYLTRQLVDDQAALPVISVSAGGGGTGGSGGMVGGNELEPPSMEDVSKFEEPQLQDTLSAVVSAVTSKSALLADESIDVGMEPVEARGVGDNRRPGLGGGSGGGAGGGIGSGFGRGKGGRSEPRREIRFEPESVQQYAEWLDYFKIELGVLGEDNKIYYAYNLSREKPEVRVGDPVDEQRLYMNPTDSQFAALDRQLILKAGIADKGQIVLQFYPTEAQAILLELEKKQAGERKPEQIRSTIFRVTRSENGFQFSVEEQFYR